MIRFFGALVVGLIFATGPLPASNQAQPAQRPPMGWNSWNHYGNKVTEKNVRAAVDAMSANGMASVGYEYVNIDDGWQGTRDAGGNLRPNDKFVDMRALADYVHSRGLKIGIYSSPGTKSCGEFEGGAGHEDQDARTFAAWGIDFVKYDICSFRQQLASEAHGDPEVAKQMMQVAYQKMSRALRQTGRPIVFSMSQHGLSEVWSWGDQVGAQLWRTGDDVRDTYESVTEIGFAQAGLSAFAGPGHWNDPDMLEVGNGGLDADESRTQLSLWALLAAPLLAGNDLSSMSPGDLAILTNPEVVAVDQDSGGHQGDRVWSRGPLEAWSRPMNDGSTVVGLFNRNAGAVWMTLDPASFHLEGPQRVRDLWSRVDLDVLNEPRRILVPRHGVALLRLSSMHSNTQR